MLGCRYLYPRSFVVTPSDGSITNIWLVQNGTKCGTNQVRSRVFVSCSNYSKGVNE